MAGTSMTKRGAVLGIGILLAAVQSPAAGPAADVGLRRDFAAPPLRFQSRPLWFWNGALSAERTQEQLGACKRRGYCGVGILPAQHMTPGFMTPGFLAQYGVAVETAAQLGLRLCLYDEYWFPSGSAGGLLAKRHPEALGKRLDMLAVDVTGPKAFAQAVPAGAFMGAVAMEMSTKKRLALTSRARDGRLAWHVPAGDWKVMLFTCVRDGAGGLVDYLDPESVKRFVELTYEAYYREFPSHFGTTIDSAFYDEPTFHWIQGGRAWTPAFNEKFRKARGFDPVPLYPALWLDIGPETASARNALFGFRAELFATGFPKVISDWCRTHRIRLTGHMDQEEIVNPVGLCGDLIKAFKHQDIPAIDQVFAYGRASKAYKLVSSAAFNYDRPLVLTECYGGINRMPLANLYKEAMDQFAKGINAMVPHAVWYDPSKIIFQPDLSPADPTYGPELPAYNAYIGRLQLMLQGGRHVADIGVLYPIATLQGGYHFDGPLKPYVGGVIPPEADYLDVGEALALRVRRDFTFVHPEVLEERCRVEGAEVLLENRVNAERYKVFIMPGSRTISAGALRRIKAFYEAGGRVVATTRLPDMSAEPGKDAEVRAAVSAIFGARAAADGGFPRVSASSAWEAGGYDPTNAADGDPGTRWNAADGDERPQWLEVEFGAPKTFGRVVVREALERTRAWRLRAWDGAAWTDCARGERLGAEAVVSFGPVTASKVRLCIDAIVSDSVSISEFEPLDAAGRNLAQSGGVRVVRRNTRGGKAVFLPSPRPAALRAALDDVLDVYDVTVEGEPEILGGNLSYIHKVVAGRHVWFFGNSSGAPVDVPVRLRDRHVLERWDPHTGGIAPQPTETARVGDVEVTRVRLTLGPVRSLFLVSGP